MILYRVESFITADFSDDDDFLSSLRSRHHSLQLKAFQVVRETPKGKWISVYHKERWVSNTSNKRFAHPTIEGAYKEFVRRKKIQRKILDIQLSDCITVCQLAEDAIRRNEFLRPDQQWLS